MGTDSVILRCLGLGELAVPPGIAVKLHDLVLPYCLARCADYGLTIAEVVEGDSAPNARYIGIRLEIPLAVDKNVGCER
jgi:hypothetical protein